MPTMLKSFSETLAKQGRKRRAAMLRLHLKNIANGLRNKDSKDMLMRRYKVTRQRIEYMLKKAENES